MNLILPILVAVAGALIILFAGWLYYVSGSLRNLWTVASIGAVVLCVGMVWGGAVVYLDGKQATTTSSISPPGRSSSSPGFSFLY